MLLFSWFKTDHLSILHLASLILSLYMAIYLFKIKAKRKCTLLLALVFFSASLYNLFWYWHYGFAVYHWQSIGWSKIIQLGSLSLTLIFLVQFAYHFPELSSSQRRESKIVLVLTTLAGLVLVSVVFQFYVLDRLTPRTYRMIENPILGSLFLWVIVVLFRKTFQLSRGQPGSVFSKLFNPQGKDARAARALAVTVLLPIGAIIVLFIGTLLKLPTRILMWFVILFFYSAFFGTYLNHIVETTTFQMKLIGIILITTLCIVSFLIVIVGRSHENNYENTTLLSAKQTIRFVPNEKGGYHISRVPLNFDSELGQSLEFGNSKSISLELKFTFPFFDHPWKEVHIANEQAIVLFGDIGSSRPVWGGYKALPAIAAMSLRLDPQAGPGVFQKSELEKTTITWYKLPAIHSSEPNTMQLVLFRNGSFEISYRELNPRMVYRVRENVGSANLVGIHPGGRNSPLEPIKFSNDLPYSSSSPSVIFEDYYTDFENHLSARMLSLALILVAASLFIIFVFPFVFRSTLIKPLQNLLQGLQKVDNGDLEVAVTPQFNDEIGLVTEAFNRMVQSIKKTDQMKDEFLANTSHELRTPLGGIIGLAESLVDGAAGLLDRAVMSNLILIESSGKRLCGVVADLLDFSQLKNRDIKLSLTAVDLREATELVFNLSRPLLAGKSIELRNEISPSLAAAWGDENRIQQILHNLIGNSIKFTDSGSITVSGTELAEMIEFTVSDTGIGIPADRQEDIFESFQQVDATVTRQYGGTGLGLSITKQLVEAHGGIIGVESTLNQGSRFCFTLPKSKQPFDRQRRTGKKGDDYLTKLNEDETLKVLPSVSIGGTNFKILTVDDELVNQQVLTNQLSLQNFSVTQAYNGYEALEAVEKEEFDLILLDIMMPRMSGYEVCQKIREHYPANELPIIMLTAKNLVSDLAEGFDSGANDYLAKPVSKNELLLRVKTHLNLAKINTAYSRFVPKDFLRLLDKESIVDVRLGDQVQKEMTILFSDIRSFTTLSESMSPEENFNFINSYLKRFVPIIQAHNGLIDKYIGDGVMALFPEKPEDALLASIGMGKELKVYNTHRKRNNYPPIQIGIGVHTGTLMLGTIGSEKRMEGTVIADAVNIASRIENLTKTFGASIIISGDTLDRLKDTFSFRPLGKVRVKGKGAKVAIYEIFIDESKDRLKIETLKDFKDGLSEYFNRNFAEASVHFDHVVRKNPDDKAAALYRQHSADFMLNGVPDDWEGV